MKLSIVTTLYRSSPFIREFYARIVREALKITDDYELIFVNDGSPDDSLEVAVSLLQADPKIRIVDLSRNFGHHKAIMTGLANAQGELVFLIDCDLEEEPELLNHFYPVYEQFNADVVYGVQDRRKGAFFERISGAVFYKLINFLSDYPIPANVLVARLMSRRYVSSLVEHQDRELFLLGLWAITGYRQQPVIVHKHSKGSSSYTLVQKLSILVNAVTSFSNLPLVFIFYLGLAIMLLSGMAASYLLVQRIFFHVYLAGWPSLIVSIWLLGGTTIFCLGILGIYLSKVFTETKRRPYTIVRQIYSKEQKT
ncbi:MAG: glycosyltransferase family 2 protein [Desulfoferrobacter sp.]